MLDLTGLWAIAELDRPDLKPVPWSPVTPPRLVPPDEDEPADVFAAIRSRRHPRPPPVRVVRRVGRAVHRPGRRRPRGPDDQADAVPDVGRLADRPVAHPGGRARQAGRRPGRDQGPLRRGGEHRLGAQARTRRRPRRLRPGRPQDPLQDRARRPPRGLAACAATSTSGPATTTPKTARLYVDLGLLTVPAGARRRRDRPVQRPDRPVAPARVPPAARRAAQPALALPRPRRPRDRPRRRRPARRGSS